MIALTSTIFQMKKILFGSQFGCFAIIMLGFTACEKDPIDYDKTEVLSNFNYLGTDPLSLTYYALKDGMVLDRYITNQVNPVPYSITITGLGSEKITSIDFRPKTNQLYGMGSNNKVFLIDPETGAATAIPDLFSTANNMPPADATTPRSAVTVAGTSFGFDFNPAADRLRIVSNTGQSLRINVETGFTIVDGSINPTPANITGVAYDNNDNDPATTTELFAIDLQNQKLFEIDPPNNGTLVEKGPTGLSLKNDGGFDIAPRRSGVTTDIGLGMYEENSKTTLFRIDVETGQTRLLIKFKTGLVYTGIAISPI